MLNYIFLSNDKIEKKLIKCTELIDTIEKSPKFVINIVVDFAKAMNLS